MIINIIIMPSKWSLYRKDKILILTVTYIIWGNAVQELKINFVPLSKLPDGHLRFRHLCFRRKNPEQPHNRYLVAVYKCQEGFTLQDPAVDRLYCSEDNWVGEQPACVATSINRLHLTSIFCITLCVSCSPDFLWSTLFYTMMNPDFQVAGLL